MSSWRKVTNLAIFGLELSFLYSAHSFGKLAKDNTVQMATKVDFGLGGGTPVGRDACYIAR